MRKRIHGPKPDALPPSPGAEAAAESIFGRRPLSADKRKVVELLERAGAR